MSPTDVDTSSVWMMLALVGDAEKKVLSCSLEGQDTKQATFTVDGTWAADIAQATQDYLEVVTSIYQSYVTFRELRDDNIQKGGIGLSSTPEEDTDSIFPDSSI